MSSGGLPWECAVWVAGHEVVCDFNAEFQDGYSLGTSLTKSLVHYFNTFTAVALYHGVTSGFRLTHIVLNPIFKHTNED